MEGYDVIAGKIADDATNRTLVAYISGTFGDMGSERADEFCIGQLLPEKHCTMNLQNYGGMGLPTLQTCIKKKLMLIN